METRRIVAAMNACDGISTKALENGVIKGLLVALKFYANEDNYDSHIMDLGEGTGHVDSGSTASADEGKRAREAVAKAEGKGLENGKD